MISAPVNRHGAEFVWLNGIPPSKCKEYSMKGLYTFDQTPRPNQSGLAPYVSPDAPHTRPPHVGKDLRQQRRVSLT